MLIFSLWLLIGFLSLLQAQWRLRVSLEAMDVTLCLLASFVGVFGLLCLYRDVIFTKPFLNFFLEDNHFTSLRN